jgi:leucyl aminopeptidase
MNIEFKKSPLNELEADVLVLLCTEDAPPHAAAKPLYAAGEFKGKEGDFALLHAPSRLASERVLFAGCGKPGALNGDVARKTAAAAIRYLKGKQFGHVAIHVDEKYVQAVTEGFLLGEFEPDIHKTDPEKTERHITRATIACAGAASAAFARGRVIAEAQNYARTLVNEPGNLLTPTALAARAREMTAEVNAAGHALTCEVLDEDRMRQLGMGSLLGVAMGSAEPPVLIVLRYTPKNPVRGSKKKPAAHLGLVGKGVTFDTGGISIKPSEGMEKMKYDMAGGAGVIGAMRAIAQLKPGIRVTAVIPSVENMPGSRAQRPGDIVKTLNGKTVEVLNTDAEGRLILNDAITYAQRYLGCTHLVDAATLTGAIVVSLGHVHVGAFSNNDAFFARVHAAAQAAGERMWRMPLDDDYKEQLKSAFADLQNIGTRWGGAITAAYFLKEFADPTPWVHLDIAGTAWLDDQKPHLAKGPTGVAVRTFVELAMGWK